MLLYTDYIKSTCDIEESVRYFDNRRLRNIITDLYLHKVKNNTI